MVSAHGGGIGLRFGNQGVGYVSSGPVAADDVRIVRSSVPAVASDSLCGSAVGSPNARAADG